MVYKRANNNKLRQRSSSFQESISHAYRILESHLRLKKRSQVSKSCDIIRSENTTCSACDADLNKRDFDKGKHDIRSDLNKCEWRRW